MLQYAMVPTHQASFRGSFPVVLTPGAAPGDVAGSRATITGLAAALGLAG